MNATTSTLVGVIIISVLILLNYFLREALRNYSDQKIRNDLNIGEEERKKRLMDSKDKSYEYFSLGLDKKSFVATILNIIIVSIAFISLIETSEQSRETALISRESLKILANKEKIDLKPSIEIDSLLYKNSQLGSPNVYIFNTGKIKAINVVVQIIRRQFNGNEFTGAAWGGGEGGMYLFDEIRAHDTKKMILSDEYVVKPEFNTIEIRISYDREYDGQTYSYRTFYFYGPEGEDFKSWFNIKQAKLLKGNPFANVIEKALKLPLQLGGDDFRDFTGNELLEF